MRATILKSISLLFLAFISKRLLASSESKIHQLSFNGLALAPNAGGQEAYRVEWYHSHHAFNLFNNRALTVGSTSLFGAGYNYRLPICSEECFWQFFSQVGGGMTNAGPYGEISWGTIIPLLPIWLPTSAPRYIPGLRIDITTQMYPSQKRLINWSYPLWAGITIAF